MLLVIAVVAAVVFLWAYTSGNRWYVGKNGLSRVGMALVGQGAGLVLILGYGVLQRLLGWPVIPLVRLCLFAVVAVMEVGIAVAFVRERQLWRGRGQRTRHGRASSDVEDKETEGAP